MLEFTDDQLKKMHFFIHAFTEIMEKAGGTDDDWKLGAGTLRGMILAEPEGEDSTMDRIHAINEYSQESLRIFRGLQDQPPPFHLNGEGARGGH